MKNNKELNNERGVALLMTLFVVALLSILVIELVDNSQLDLRVSRSFSEKIQSDYILKSLMNYGRVMIAMPKQEDFNGNAINADWTGDSWARAESQVTTLAFPGEPEMKLQIIDEDSKININSILSDDAGQIQNIWKTALKELFLSQGFFAEEYEEEDARTLGNETFDAGDQVAIIRDWIDEDSDNYNSVAIGEGIESLSRNEEFFYNRPLENLSELLLVPGMTLERLYRIAPYVKVKGQNQSSQININTADPLVLATAFDLDPAQVEGFMILRPITNVNDDAVRTISNALTQGRIKTTSSEFSIVARVEMPNETRWLKALVIPTGSPTNRRGTDIVELSFY